MEYFFLGEYAGTFYQISLYGALCENAIQTNNKEGDPLALRWTI